MSTILTAQPTSAALPSKRPAGKVVVVQSGARDAYQVALALDEAGALDTLVTDLYWSANRIWAKSISGSLPERVRSLLFRRTETELSSDRVNSCALHGLCTLLLDKIPGVPFGLRKRMTRRTDRQLGRIAGKRASQQGSALLSYSYYGDTAFRNFYGCGILFQLHPHPRSMRRILAEELKKHPDCAASLTQEWELALSHDDFERLASEATRVKHIIAASSFTRSTLVENGAAASSVRVVPYGVDANRFKPDEQRRPSTQGKLKLLFVGRINQRKGIKDLVEAIRLINFREVELTICGRVVDDLSVLRSLGECVTVRPNVSSQELSAAYQSSHLFTFPSIAEGFAHVLLESLASGLPILSTNRTAAPDLIQEGEQGFVVDVGRPDHLAERIEWTLTHRAQLDRMRGEARELAKQFTWSRFRAGIVSAVMDAMHQEEGQTRSAWSQSLAV